MIRVMMAGIAAGTLLTAVATVPNAEAFPAGKVQAPVAGSMVTDVRRGGPGGGGGGYGGGGGGGPGHGHGGGGPGHGHGGGGPGHGPGPGWGGGGGHHHHGHGRGFRFYGAPFVGYGAYYGGYSEGCGWLRRRALATGSRYWWARYEDCVDDNY
jgi:hypothetical protein